MDLNNPQIQHAMDEVQRQIGLHGGKVELLAINDQGVALVRLGAACAGCSGAQNTVRNVVEKTLKQHLPGINAVEAIF